MVNSALNIFTKEIQKRPAGSNKIYSSAPTTVVPNWPVIILFSLGMIAVIVALSVILYRVWRKKNCHPIYFAGKVRYARHGATINDACKLSGYGECWLNNRINDLSTQGKIVGLYLDADLTIPLDRKQRVTAPIRIYPKITK